MTFDGGGVNKAFEPDPPTRVAYALLDIGGRSVGVIGLAACFALEKPKNREDLLDVVRVLFAGLRGSTEALANLLSSPSSTMSSKLRNVNAASRFDSLTGLRGGRGAEDFGFGAAPKSKVGKKDSGAGAVIG